MRLAPLQATAEFSGDAAPAAVGGSGRTVVAVALSALTLLVVALAAAAVGKAALPFSLPFDLLGQALGQGGVAVPAPSASIFLEIRLPRIVLAGLVGAALSVSGAAYQGLFRNDLADPYVLGVAAGAALGAVVAFVLPLPAAVTRGGAVQLFAFVGAAAVVALVLAIAGQGRMSGATLLLAGVAVGSVANAVCAFLMYTHGDQLLVIYGWLLGGFNVASWAQVRQVTLPIAVSAGAILLGGRTLDLLQFGDEEAASLGVDVARARFWLTAAATLAAAAAVSVAGLIGFVGLLVPHAARLLVGPEHHRLLLVSGLLGAAFLIAADAVARGLPGPAELPVGIVTAVVGGPFFLYLLHREGRLRPW